MPQSSTDTANPDAPLTAQAPLRTAPAEDPVPAPDQNSENLAKKSVGNSVQESAATAPLSVSGRNESTSEQTTNSTDDSDTLNFPEELNTLKHELSAINIDQTTRLVTVENRLNRLRKLLPPDSLQPTETLASLTASLQIKLAQNADYQLEMESTTKNLVSKLDALISTETIDSQISTVLEDWRSIQNNLNNSSGEVRARIKEMANPFKEKIQALRE